MRRRGPEEQASQREAQERLGALLNGLDDDKRVVFVMFEIEGIACEEIAEALSIPVGTVYSRLHTARKALQKAAARSDLRNPHERAQKTPRPPDDELPEELRALIEKARPPAPIDRETRARLRRRLAAATGDRPGLAKARRWRDRAVAVALVAAAALFLWWIAGARGTGPIALPVPDPDMETPPAPPAHNMNPGSRTRSEPGTAGRTAADRTAAARAGTLFRTGVPARCAPGTLRVARGRGTSVPTSCCWRRRG